MKAYGQDNLGGKVIDATPYLAEVPSYDLELATGGEDTYDLECDVKPSEAVSFLTRWGRRGFTSRVVRRKAQAGEPLRRPNLKLKINSTQNGVHRAKVRVRFDHDQQYRALQMLICSSSLMYFLNVFVWIEDPRNRQNPRIPLVTFPFQGELCAWVLNLISLERSGLVEKSRDMGASWIFAAIAVWLAVFHDSMKVFQMSLTEDDVGERTTNSMLGKCRFILSNLPPEMRKGFKEQGQDIDSKMLLKVPGSGSELKGVLSNSTVARGGRATVMNWDEAAWAVDDKAVAEALPSLAGSYFAYSSVHGMDNEFARLAHDPGTEKLRLHWSSHPMKDTKWAISERSNTIYTDESWAQEHEIEYETSTSGRVYPQFVSRSPSPLQWSHAGKSEFHQYDPKFPVILLMDMGLDANSMWYGQVKPGPKHFEHIHQSLVIFDGDEEEGWSPHECAALIKSKPWYKAINLMIGDPRTLNQRSRQTKITDKQVYESLGMHFEDPKYNTQGGIIREVQRVLEIPGAFSVNETNCSKLVRAFQGWSYPTDKYGVVKPGSTAKHDHHSHSMTAVAYGIDHMFGLASELGKGRKRLGKDEWDFKQIGGTRYR